MDFALLQEDDGVPPALSPRRSCPTSCAVSATFLLRAGQKHATEATCGRVETEADRTVQIISILSARQTEIIEQEHQTCTRLNKLDLGSNNKIDTKKIKVCK
jgi:hypothetical protein